jgi:hypothetical protein
MFLIGMTDIFLILYLTSLAGVQSTSVLTVEDFYKLQSMHETLQDDKKRAESELQKQLDIAREEKVDLAARLAREQAIAGERLAQIDQDLLLKNMTLKESEERLTQLDQKIREKDAAWQQREASYKQELEGQKGVLEANRVLAEKFQSEAQKAQQLAEQRQKEAAEAAKAAEEAKALEKHAIKLKEAALKEKGEAERKAHEAHEARKKAEAEKDQALQKASKLTAAINDMNQDSAAAFRSNVQPNIQQLNVSYEDEVSGTTKVLRRELALLPILINEQAFVLMPCAHIGFSRRYDTAPSKLEITYNGKKILHGFINKKEDLIAVALPGYAGKIYATYQADAKIDEFMPVLLALRNNGDVNITNLFRGLSAHYFAVNRDNIEPYENVGLKHTLKGWRGTGQRAERIIRGDQLVDLNGRFIGIANDPDQIIRIDSLKGWEEITFQR